jgi:type VI secretion system secreted protein VgrG
LPRAAITEVPVRFHFRLQDAPGFAAQPYPNTKWRLVRAANEVQALGSETVILAGRSDSDGEVILTDQDESKLHEAYNDTPNSIWLVANSHARALEINVEQGDWTSSEKFYQGLRALGYTDELGTTNGQDVEDFVAPLARSELKTSSGTSLLKKLKKDSR